MNPTTQTRAAALAERTADAYSWDNYGERGWRATTAWLLTQGYTEQETEAILRSKHTRWAADSATERPTWRYGRTTSADFARYWHGLRLDHAAEVRMLVEGTF